MTLAVGIATRHGVWIGADSGTTADNATDRSYEPKIFRKSGWLIAGSGEWRVMDLVRYACDLPRPGENPHRTLCIDVKSELEKTFTEHGFDLKTDDEGTPYAPYFLLFSDGHMLWQIDHEGHAERRMVTTIGTGADYALGWLDRSDLGPAPDRVKAVLRATSKRYGMLQAPFTVEKA